MANGYAQQSEDEFDFVWFSFPCNPLADLHYVASNPNREVPSRCAGWLLAWYAFLVTFLILVAACQGLILLSLGLQDYKLTSAQIVALVLICLGMFYLEGYRGFHRSWAPVTARRCLLLPLGLQQDCFSFLMAVLAPIFAAGFIYAPLRRLVVSYLLVAFIVSLIVLVKRLPPPWHEMVDCGVAVGLGSGTLSFCYYFLRAIWEKKLPPDMDGKRKPNDGKLGKVSPEQDHFR
eukprot:gb/GEZN01015895.1/.p1 GENE.gb/GEZN01015895.1/~~gb/GEZN01015895.1/.p1  ORF type:complete len:233 (+),score=23.60 gb/GEZN01015895.1/:92-790(+)